MHPTCPPLCAHSPTRHLQWQWGHLTCHQSQPPPPPPASSAQELCREEQEGRARPQSPRQRAPGEASCLACFPAQPHLVCSLRAVGGGVGRAAQDTVTFAASMGKGPVRSSHMLIQAPLTFQKPWVANVGSTEVALCWNLIQGQGLLL